MSIPESAVDARAPVREGFAMLVGIPSPQLLAAVGRVDQHFEAREQVWPESAAVVEVERGATRPPPESPDIFAARVLIEPVALAVLHDVGVQTDPVVESPAGVEAQRYEVRFVAADHSELVQSGDGRGSGASARRDRPAGRRRTGRTAGSWRW